jgi:hypothetical protein
MAAGRRNCAVWDRGEVKSSFPRSAWERGDPERRTICQVVKRGLELNSKRGCQLWWQLMEASLRVRAWITTPFILERANHSKGWDAKPRAFGLSLDGGRAAEGVDTRRTHRPSHDLRPQEATRSRPDPGPEQSGTRRLALLLAPCPGLRAATLCTPADPFPLSCSTPVHLRMVFPHGSA